MSTALVRLEGGPADGDLIRVPARQLVPALIVHVDIPDLDEGREEISWRNARYVQAARPAPDHGGAWRYVHLSVD